MFVSKIRLYNNLKINSTNKMNELAGEDESLFGKKTTRLIECAFEKSGKYWFDDKSDGDHEYHSGDYESTWVLRTLPDTVSRAVRFGERHEDPEKRLLAIMRNVIKNEGVFIP